MTARTQRWLLLAIAVLATFAFLLEISRLPAARAWAQQQGMLADPPPPTAPR